MRDGKYVTQRRTFDEELDFLIYQSKEERPTALRSNIVEKYVREVLNKKKNPQTYELKLAVVKQMIRLNFDNRVLNQMRQTMNEQIEDERGHMLKSDFKRMLFTAFKAVDDDKKRLLFDMLCPLISAEKEDCSQHGDEAADGE